MRDVLCISSDVLIILTIRCQVISYWESSIMVVRWDNLWISLIGDSSVGRSSASPSPSIPCTPTPSSRGLSSSGVWWPGRNVSQLRRLLEPYLPISHTLHRLSKLQWFLSHNKRTRAGRSVSLLSAATGRPLTSPPPTISVITTQLLQITAARALFVIKFE